MTTVTAKIEVRRLDDVAFSVDAGEFLDAIGPVDQKVEDAVNEALDAYVDAHAYYQSERWYNLLHERDSQKILREALASALGVTVEEVSADYGFATCNWQNCLSGDFGGTLWNLPDGRTFLTIESGENGHMRAAVQVRTIECQEPTQAIAYCSSEVTIGCTECDYSLDTGVDRIEWTDLTRADDDGWPLEQLFCPNCSHPMAAEVWI